MRKSEASDGLGRRARVPAAYRERLANLEAAPIVLSASRTRAVLLFLACAAFIALGVVAIARGEEDVRAVALPTALLFGLGLAVSGALIARPPVMTVDADGVRLRTIFRSWGVAWDEVGPFFVHRLRAPGPSAVPAPDVVAFALREPPTTGWRRFRILRASGCDGTFGGGWPLSAPALADLLNAARERVPRETPAP